MIARGYIVLDTDVVIVGCGPTGATLANLLGSRGVNTLVLEKEPQPYALPRAVHFDDEVMRVMQSVGIASELVKKIRVNPGMRFVDEKSSLLLDWPRPMEKSGNGWHPSYRFHQPDLESLLRKQLGQHSSVQVRLSAEVLTVSNHADGCELTWINRAGNSGDSVNSVRAQYVVGCDGANSAIRQALKIDWIDLGFHQRWLVVDVLLKKPRPDLGDVTIQHCEPSRPITYVRCPENRRRWEMTVLEHESSEEVRQPESVWSLLSRWITPEEADIERAAVYTFQSTLASKWLVGRCLLAGDAAHLTPPFMGQGMCGGIRDVANLAWKLIECVKQQHSQHLLQSYQYERYPHMQKFIQTAMSLGSLISNTDSRDALQQALTSGEGNAKMRSLNMPIVSSLAAGSSQHQGQLCLQPSIRGTLIDDRVGYAPVVLVEEALLEEYVVPSGTTSPRLISSKEDSSIESLLADLQTRAIYVRPDRYILGTASTWEELDSLVNFNAQTAP